MHHSCKCALTGERSYQSSRVYQSPLRRFASPETFKPRNGASTPPFRDIPSRVSQLQMRLTGTRARQSSLVSRSRSRLFEAPKAYFSAWGPTSPVSRHSRACFAAANVLRQERACFVASVYIGCVLAALPPGRRIIKPRNRTTAPPFRIMAARESYLRLRLNRDSPLS